MKNLKYVIIVLVIIVILIIGVTFVLIFNNDNNDDIVDEGNGGSEVEDYEEDLYEVETLGECIAVTEEYEYKNCISIIDDVFEYIEDNNSIALVAILDSQYMEDNNITETNVMNKLSSLKTVNSFYIKELYSQVVMYMQDINQQSYFVKLLIRQNGTENNLYIKIRENLENNITYSIQFTNEAEYTDLINGLDELNTESIEENDYNELKYENISQTFCNIFLEDYKNSIENNKQLSYNLLNEEYREARFSNVSEYVNYLTENEEEFANRTIEKYSYTETDTYKEYMCIDNYGKYIIFRYTDFMEYNVLLDEYTIDVPQFVEKYENSDYQMKVALNINKFFEGLNDENYKYSYSVLADSFKENKYPTIDDFIADVQENLFENCEVSYVTFSQQGSNYSYTLNVTDADGIEEETKIVTVIMKINDGTDFEMSFSIS